MILQKGQGKVPFCFYLEARLRNRSDPFASIILKKLSVYRSAKLFMYISDNIVSKRNTNSNKCPLNNHMKMVLIFCLVVMGIVSCNVSEAQNSKLRLAWVTINQIDYNDEKLVGEAEDGLLDMGFDKQVSLAEQCRYYKKTVKILSDAGVQNGSEISINFDPVYEQVTFHRINIIRDGHTINKLLLSRFKTIQQEKELYVTLMMVG